MTLRFYYSTPGSTQGGTIPGTPNGSLGKYVSDTEVVGGPNTLFDNVSGTEARSGHTDHRCIFIRNTGADTFSSVRLWVEGREDGAQVSLGIDAVPVSDYESTAVQASSIASEGLAPAGVTFPSDVAENGLAVGDLPPNHVRAVWLKRVVTADQVARSDDGITLRLTYAGAPTADPGPDPEPPPPEPGAPVPNQAGAKFPGHVPNRVLIGMATPADGAPVGPTWTEARAIIGQPIYEARRFTGQWISASAFNEMVAQADAANALPVISFKPSSAGSYPNATAAWAAVRDGDHDDDLVTLANLVKAYGKNILVSFHHEPAGDGDLAVWAQMQERMVWWFAGYRNASWSGSAIVKGAYNAAHDLSLNNGGKMGWAPIGNGFWWRSMTVASLAADRAAAWPQSLINALNACRGVVLNDFYDADYVNQDAAYTSESARVPGTGVRTSKRILNFITWARSKGVKASGAGEYGVIDSAEMLACWKVMRENRDIWCIGNYFNSLVNSDHEWRLIPADWPDTNYESDKTNSNGDGFQDFGGNAQSAGRLAAFKTTLTESVSAAYTGPL